jgi:C_GCAxxG_C_C family probable redox protein
MTKADTAQDLFDQGFNCSQSVFATFADDLGMARADALRVAAAFGGGIGRTGATCGVVTGALMALGLKYGMTRADPQAKERMYVIAQEFMRRFEAKHGSLTCKGLLGVDLSTAEGRQQAKERNTHGAVCTGLVSNATTILQEMLERE